MKKQQNRNASNRNLSNLRNNGQNRVSSIETKSRLGISQGGYRNINQPSTAGATSQRGINLD